MLEIDGVFLTIFFGRARLARCGLVFCVSWREMRGMLKLDTLRSISVAVLLRRNYSRYAQRMS